MTELAKMNLLNNEADPETTSKNKKKRKKKKNKGIIDALETQWVCDEEDEV